MELVGVNKAQPVDIFQHGTDKRVNFAIAGNKPKALFHIAQSVFCADNAVPHTLAGDTDVF